MYLSFWRAPDPHTGDFIEQVVLPDWNGNSNITSISCERNKCEGNPFGIRLRGDLLDLCFMNDHCSLFLRIDNINAPVHLSVEILAFSSTCLIEKGSSWKSDSCQINPASTDTDVYCVCKNLTDKVMMTTKTNELSVRINYLSG